MSDQGTTISRWQKVRDAVRRGPLGKTKLYQLAQKHHGLMRDLDGMTIVDMDLYDEILAELPPTELKEPNAA
jgi:hypothetical protein